ncbi:MAG: cupredoxin domain-containing protein [Anaerolineales bacterium]|nr:cupredoxin domain-containing protein [Anaerolineales bacterium]
MTTLESVSSIPQQSLKWLLGGFCIGALAAVLFLAVNSIFPNHPGAITIKTSGLQYSETEIHAKVGQIVNLELFNMDGYAHGFDIDALNIHVKLPGSQTTIMTFTPTEPGVYQFYCGAYGHKAAGMVGTLIVEP